MLLYGTSCWFGIPTVAAFYDDKLPASLTTDIHDFGHSLQISCACVEIETPTNTTITLILCTPYHYTDFEFFRKAIKQKSSSETDPKMHWFEDKPPSNFFKKWNGDDCVFFFVVDAGKCYFQYFD